MPRKLLLFTTFIITVILPFTTCTKSVVVPEPCFQKDILPLFASKCGMNGCHSSNGKNHGFDLTSYDGIMKGVKPNHPLQSAVYNNCDGLNPAMPPNKADRLSREELSKLRYWINIGSPNSTNCSGNSCDTSQHSYANDIKPIFSSNCVGCHNSSNQLGGIDLSNYAGVSSTLSTNKLLGSIKHNASFIAMPPSYQIDACSISKIEKWIEGGGLNN